MGITVSIYLIHPGAHPANLSGIPNVAHIPEFGIFVLDRHNSVLVAQNSVGFQIFGVRPANSAMCLPNFWAALSDLEIEVFSKVAAFHSSLSER